MEITRERRTARVKAERQLQLLQSGHFDRLREGAALHRRHDVAAELPCQNLSPRESRRHVEAPGHAKVEEETEGVDEAEAGQNTWETLTRAERTTLGSSFGGSCSVFAS